MMFTEGNIPVIEAILRNELMPTAATRKALDHLLCEREAVPEAGEREGPDNEPSRSKGRPAL